MEHKPIGGLIHNMLKSTRDTRMTYFIVLTGAAFIGIMHLLPARAQITIMNVLRIPIIMALLLIITMIIGYFNIIGGVILLLMLVCLILPIRMQKNSELAVISSPGTSTIEGFKSGEDENGLNSNNKVIKDLLKPGKFRKELDEARKVNKDLFEKEMANNKFMEYEYNKKKSQKKEKFQALSQPGDKTIQQRKFNPSNQEDVNLLATMDIFEDIRDRIKYNYEDKKYLKRYIKEKLEEVVDMLDLIEPE